MSLKKECELKKKSSNNCSLFDQTIIIVFDNGL